MKTFLFSLILLTVLAYLNSFGNSFVWDDQNNIVHNEHLKEPVILRNLFLSPQESPAQFYRPLSYLSIRIDHALWGLKPFGYHLTNFVFHLFNAILILLLAIKLTNSTFTSFVVAALFALHPVQTEAVTYISGRSDPICLFFLLCSFYAYIKYLSLNGHKKEWVFSAAIVSFAAALFSKEIALVFPGLIFLYDFLFYDSPSRIRLKRNLPFILTGISFLLFRFIFIRGLQEELVPGKIYLLPKLLLLYLKMLILPFNLHMHYSLNDDVFFFGMPLFLSALIFIGTIILALKQIKRRPTMFGLGWFLMGLLPYLGLFKLNSGMAEHWLYLASFGFFLVIGQLAAKKKKLVLFMLVFLSVLTVRRNFVWRDDASIYQDTLKYNPYDPGLHYNLGNAYLRGNDLDNALQEYSTALMLKPGYAYALNNMGIILEKKHKMQEALDCYKEAVKISPDLTAAVNNIRRFQFLAPAFAEEPTHDAALTSGAVKPEHSLLKNYNLYDKVLVEFVSDGRVDYPALKKNIALLDNYLEEIAQLNPEVLESASRNEKIAFYINAYNALTLRIITVHYPVKSIKDIPGVWDKLKFKVAGRELTLGYLEHEILRKEFKEPRIHFALVCASIGCPELADQPFTGKDLNAQLDKQAQKFINNKSKVRLDRKNNIFYLSSIFKWFKEDFGDVIAFIGRYLPEDEANLISDEYPRIKYLSYDWLLNSKR